MQDLHNTYNSRGREPSTRPGGISRSRTEPLAPRAVRPGGANNPRGEAASTYGNTGKRRPADWYLLTFESLAIFTEILRWRSVFWSYVKSFF